MSYWKLDGRKILRLSKESFDGEDFLIFYHIWELKNHLRKLNKGRLSHFDGAYFYGMEAGFNGVTIHACPYRATYYYGRPDWGGVWEDAWVAGHHYGKRLKKKVENL
ncbi:unnamed protein product [marine sediment metagenome]|uniref:Uncharacterized protein n=1 Tax=marine sediment metagenome TaxID=412755 RepID=X0YP30_9ZZZZ